LTLAEAGCFETNQNMRTRDIGMAAVRSHSRLGMWGERACAQRNDNLCT